MSSMDLARSEINRFIQTTVPEILCISGEWGVGKTFTWEKLLGEATSERKVALARYAYVSLFGLTNLDAVKQALFENTEFLITDDDEFRRQAKELGNWTLGGLKKGRSMLAAIPYVGSSLEKAISGSNAAIFATIRNQIVCIDDVERRGKDLRVKDVLGMASFLKEQRGCKVAILLNDKKLGSEGDDFDEQTEKVIDSFIRFTPSPAESVCIAMDHADPTSAAVGDRCEKLGISNIRVIKRVDRLTRIAVSALKDRSPEVLEFVIHYLVVLGWSKFEPSTAPSLDFIKAGRSRLQFTTNAEPFTDAENRWNSVLRDYKLGSFDELAEELQRGIENGFFDAGKLQSLGAQREASIDRLRGERQISEAWDLFRNSFNDNADEVAAAMDVAMKSAPQVSLLNVNSSVSLIRALGRQKDADRIVDDFVGRDLDPEFWNLSRNPLASEVTDETFRLAVIAKYESVKVEPSLDDALIAIGSRSGWRDEDIERIANADEQKIEQLIKGSEGERLRCLLDGLLMFRNISNPTPKQREVNRKAEAVLRKIGSESPINAVRVRQRLRGG